MTVDKLRWNEGISSKVSSLVDLAVLPEEEVPPVDKFRVEGSNRGAEGASSHVDFATMPEEETPPAFWLFLINSSASSNVGNFLNLGYAKSSTWALHSNLQKRVFIGTYRTHLLTAITRLNKHQLSFHELQHNSRLNFAVKCRPLLQLDCILLVIVLANFLRRHRLISTQFPAKFSFPNHLYWDW